MDMSPVDCVAHEMLSGPGSAVVSSKDVWTWVRQKSKLKGESVSDVIKDALNKAFHYGLIELVDPPGRPKGRKVIYFKKRTWADILSSGQEAPVYAERLLLTSDHFP